MHFTIKGQESVWAAEASECAAEQSEDMFWAYHDKLFAVAGDKNHPPFNKENLKGFAAELGLSAQTFNDCLDSDKYYAVVKTNNEAANFLRFQGTPAFLINGRPLVGAQPYEVFQKYIDEELNK